MAKIIGIDLGTTYSAVSVYEKRGEDGPGQATMIPNLRGRTTTPSVVSINSSKEIIVGAAAKNNLEQNPDDTIIEVKRLMGCSPEEVKGRTAGRGISLSGSNYQPEQVSAFILRDLKVAAERYLGEPVFDAIITCPAHFGETQKAATKRAGTLAGLNVHQVMAEPVAAAIAYGVQRASQDRQVFVVYDLGGGTFDVSVITVQGEDIEVIATGGNPRLGGADFDDAIVDWVVSEVQKIHAVDLSKDRAAKARIKAKAEEAKIQLSSSQSVDISIPFIAIKAGAPLSGTFTLSRGRFEAMILKHLKQTMDLIRGTIDSASKKDELSDDAITAILLVGGSSRIPCIKELLQKKFPNIAVRADLEPDHIVAQGAAFAASSLRPVAAAPALDGTLPSPEKRADPGDGGGLEVRVFNITNHSLGVAVGRERKFQKIIPKSRDVPTQEVKGGYTTMVDNQPHVMVEVYEGESEFVEAPDMNKIGEFKLGGWEPGPAGHVEFEVTFDIAQDGILSVSARELKSGVQAKGQFQRKDLVGAASMEELQRQIQGAKQEGVGAQTAPKASGNGAAAPAQDELSRPPNLPDDLDGYWMEAVSKVKTADAATASKLREVMSALRGTLGSGDQGKIEAAGTALRDLLFDL